MCGKNLAYLVTDSEVETLVHFFKSTIIAVFPSSVTCIYSVYPKKGAFEAFFCVARSHL
uniref:Uncharacterized protein n=1 Tax=Anguilla anguilla TaxID=7936 RepID=A0A0E9PBN7_ANGAN